MKYTTHCFYCDKCIENYDHHCYWINNCVGKNNIDLFFVFLIVIILNILVNTYLDIYCLVNKFDNNGLLIFQNSSVNSLYKQSKFRFTKNFFFFDLPNEESDTNLTYDFDGDWHSEYFLSEDLQRFFSLNREKTLKKIKFIKQDKVLNSSLIESNYCQKNFIKKVF